MVRRPVVHGRAGTDLRGQLDAIKISRDSLLTENGELKKDIRRLRSENDKLKKQLAEKKEVEEADF